MIVKLQHINRIYYTSLCILLCVTLLTGCKKTTQQEESSPVLTAQQIMDKAIDQMGGDLLQSSHIQFKFRDYYYLASRHKGLRVLERCVDADCSIQQDRVDEYGNFKRFRESVEVPLPDSIKTRYTNSVNSVHYFSVLPYGLNDGAVNKTLIDEHTVKAEPYYRIKVTFAQEGGGEDFQDEYMYWIHTVDYTVDYLAYNYQVDGGGTRFREAYNRRTVNGVAFADYRNYKAATKFPSLTALDSLFETEQLSLLSTIDLEKVQVTPN